VNVAPAVVDRLDFEGIDVYFDDLDGRGKTYVYESYDANVIHIIILDKQAHMLSLFTLNLYYAKSHSTLLALRVSPTSLTLLNDSIRTLCSAPDASLLTRGVLIRFLPLCLRKGKLLMYLSACAHSTRRLTAMFMCSNRSSHQSSLKDQLLMN